MGRVIVVSYRQRLTQESGRVNYREAADFIGTSEVMVSHLVRANQLPATDQFQLKIEMSDVIRFADEKMLTSELSKRTGVVCKLIRPYMADLGVKPIATTTQGRGFIWSCASLRRSHPAGRAEGLDRDADIAPRLRNGSRPHRV
jgi:hypothetical protein